MAKEGAGLHSRGTDDSLYEYDQLEIQSRGSGGNYDFGDEQDEDEEELRKEREDQYSESGLKKGFQSGRQEEKFMGSSSRARSNSKLSENSRRNDNFGGEMGRNGFQMGSRIETESQNSKRTQNRFGDGKNPIGSQDIKMSVESRSQRGGADSSFQKGRDEPGAQDNRSQRGGANDSRSQRGGLGGNDNLSQLGGFNDNRSQRGGANDSRSQRGGAGPQDNMSQRGGQGGSDNRSQRGGLGTSENMSQRGFGENNSQFGGSIENRLQRPSAHGQRKPSREEVSRFGENSQSNIPTDENKSQIGGNKRSIFAQNPNNKSQQSGDLKDNRGFFGGEGNQTKSLFGTDGDARFQRERDHNLSQSRNQRGDPMISESATNQLHYDVTFEKRSNRGGAHLNDSRNQHGGDNRSELSHSRAMNRPKDGSNLLNPSKLPMNVQMEVYANISSASKEKRGYGEMPRSSVKSNDLEVISQRRTSPIYTLDQTFKLLHFDSFAQFLFVCLV